MKVNNNATIWQHFLFSLLTSTTTLLYFPFSLSFNCKNNNQQKTHYGKDENTLKRGKQKMEREV